MGIQLLEHAAIETAGPVCLWFAEDRGQWVLTGPDQMGNSRIVRARINSRAWWPWEAHLGGTTSPSALGSAPFAAAPPWQGGAMMLASSCTPWEELVEADGTLEVAPRMRVDAIFEKKLIVTASEHSRHAFLGSYDYAGLLSSRPFFVQNVATNPEVEGEEPNPLESEAIDEAVEEGEMQPETRPVKFVLWYAEDVDCWVFTQDFRILDCMSADSRSEDSAWFPWDVANRWQV